MEFQEPMDALENMASRFQNALDVLHHPQPSSLWHYTGIDGMLGILRTGRLWVPSTLPMADSLEIHWGNQIVRSVVMDLASENNHPALAALLREPTPLFFLREDEMFVACFTTDADVAVQWDQRNVCSGGALVLDGAELSKLVRMRNHGGTGLVRVQYDDTLLAELTKRYIRSVLECAERFKPDDQLDEYWRVVAQYLIEPGGLSFFWKQHCYSWENEWRLIVRKELLPTRFILDEPRRRIEVPLPGVLLRKVVLGRNVEPEHAEEVRKLVKDYWQTEVEFSQCE